MTIIIPPTYLNLIFNISQTAISKETSWAMGVTNFGDEDLLQVASDVSDEWVNTLRDETYSNAFLRSVTAVDATSSVEFPRNAFGLKAGDNGDIWNSVIVKKRSALKGQRHRGRAFMAGMLSDDDTLSDGLIDPARVTDIQAAASAFRSAVSAAGYQPVILHTEGPASGDAPDLITFLQVSDYVGVQRRRRVRA